MLSADASSIRAQLYLWMDSRANDRYVIWRLGVKMKKERAMSYLGLMLIDLAMKTKIEYRLFLDLT